MARATRTSLWPIGKTDWLRLIAAAVFCLLGQSAAWSQVVKVNIQTELPDSFMVKVNIELPVLGYDNQTFVFPANVPGTVRELHLAVLASNFTALDSNGNRLSFTVNNANEISIHHASALRSIHYTIHDTWHHSDPTITLPQLGTDFSRGKHFLFNFFAVAGYLDGFDMLPIELSIFKPKNLFLHTVLKKQPSAEEVDAFSLRNYFDLIDNPVMYSKTEPLPFSIGGTRFRVGLYSENENVKMAEVMKVLRPVADGVYQFCHDFTAKDYYFIVNYVNPRTDNQPSEEVYGAVQHSGCSVFYLPETDDKHRQTRDLMYTAAHEMFHLFAPLNFKTDATAKLNLRAKLETQHLWMFEGVTEYMSLLMLYRYDLITQAEFLTEIRNKINLMDYNEPFSLVDESLRMHLEGNERKYSNFYYKGAIVAFMTDLELLKVSKGEMSLLDLLLRLKRVTPDNYVVKDDRLLPELVRLSYPEMKDFFDQYVSGHDSIDYNKFLSTIGLVYESHRTDTAYLYANAQYKYNKNTDEVYMTQITLNNVGFKEGDVLVKINKATVTKDNVDMLLATITDLSYDREVVFTIRRNGQEMKLTGDPMLVRSVQKNVIKAEKEPKPEKIRYSKTFKQGKYRLQN